MRQSHYVRNLTKVQNDVGVPGNEFTSLVGNSYATLRRIKKGEPVTEKIANRIQSPRVEELYYR